MAERNSLLDTLTNIAKNGYKSINGKGLLTIMTRRTEKNGRDAIEIEDPRILEKVFQLLICQKYLIFSILPKTEKVWALAFGEIRSLSRNLAAKSMCAV